MKNYQKILLTPTSTIKNALEVINEGAMQIALVVDDKQKLLGTLTDGDIRRGLLKNLSLEDSIETIIFKKPTICKQEDSEEQIVKIAIAKKINHIPVVNNHGQLVDLKEVNVLLRPKNKTNMVFLIAGGLGTRLYPLTHNTPKPLLKVGNKPILETIIKNFAKYGFVNITICINYKSELIREYFGDGTSFGVSIEYIQEPMRLGTAGALSLIKNKPQESFLVMNADLLTNVNFDHLLEFHETEKSFATMCVREYDYQVPYGVVDTKGSTILSIKEKPLYKFFVNAGIYVLSPQALNFIPKNQFYDMPTLYEEVLQKKLKSVSFPIYEYWLDIGQISDFKKAQSEYHEIF